MNPFDELRLKAENGDPAAQIALAEVFYNSQGPGTNPSQALEWFRKAAEQGLNEARYKLGLMFQLGYGGCPV